MSATEIHDDNERGPLLGLGSSAGLGRGAEIARLVEYLKSGGMHDGISQAIFLLWEQEAEIERLRGELQEWEKLRDPVILHANLLRGLPARMSREALLHIIGGCPVAIMDTRDALGLCAPTEEDFPALYALQGHCVALVDLGPNVANNRP